MNNEIPSIQDNVTVAKISFRNSYNDGIITIYANHDYYITMRSYNPATNDTNGLLPLFKTISGKVIGINPSIKVIEIKTSSVDELTTKISLGSILSAVPINTNNDQINCDFVGIEISSAKLVLALHLKYLTGDYTVDMIPGELYEFTYVDSRNMKLITKIGKLVYVNYPYNDYYYDSVNTDSLVVQARNQNPNCIFSFDCSDEFSSTRVKLDIRSIRAIKNYIYEAPEEPEEELPAIPDGFSYYTAKDQNGNNNYLSGTDDTNITSILYGK